MAPSVDHNDNGFIVMDSNESNDGYKSSAAAMKLQKTTLICHFMVKKVNCLGDILRRDQPYPRRGASLLISEQVGKNLVAGIREQESSARSRVHPLLDHSVSRPPARSQEPFLLKIGAGRPSPYRLMRRALLSENLGTSPLSHNYDSQAPTSESWGKSLLSGSHTRHCSARLEWLRRRLWGAEQKASVNREEKKKKSEETMDVGGGSAQGGDLRLNESVTLREIANEAREKVMYERMEQMEKQMETLTTILHELRNERRGIQEEGMKSGGMTPGHIGRRNNDNMMRGRTTRRFGGEVGNQSLRGESHGGGDQSPGRQVFDDDGVVNVEEKELRQHLHDVEQERDQVAARDPGRAIQLEEEVRRLAQIIDDMQGRSRAPGWRIMLDGESPLSAEIMSAVIPRDFRFPDLKYSRRTDPLVHIERFNDITGVHGLSQAQRCRVFLMSLEGRAREWY
ncbi:hypothetical protein WN944_018748 [Citrus x changshan-huyou]|uniref:Retrotransposon gag domain-containing protein n=1 Tax=Citrus x changshan-huyou TaxID=2935761 RepID=A0AAP0QFQ3_9ROSI